ncbi:hypothetical protein FC093_03240 [Ilyomonas limi]|uniref:Outer membrane protein beta-barrel domain-containing protein n=1 Tax=Ilyomonas limi TaxID=2575867 RepID=A0A4U3LBA1_9BACT|nr:hypothetical protein [Ilyomonas limi]TKK72039.1 hypothetical protein FC093_03240 [Ilyomonas limi]
MASLAQTNAFTLKECWITGGTGIGAATQNTKSVGQDMWVQLAYRLSERISIATEFENINYKQRGYYKNLPVEPNEVNVLDNNFSLLFKYHLPLKSKLKVAAASGWTYAIRQNDYYIFEDDGVVQHTFKNVTSFSDYSIPLLLEIEYPISKTIHNHARGKYNLLRQNGSTYSTGLGLSLKL